MKERWQVIHECDDNKGNATAWSLEVSGSGFYWIDLSIEGTYDVISNDTETVLKSCKSLESAKRWVTINLL